MVSVVCLLAGCRDLLGIDDPPPPINTSIVTGRFVMHEPVNRADHTPIVNTYPMPITSATATLDDETVVPVTLHGDGTFELGTRADDQRYRLRFQIADWGADLEIQHASRHLELAEITRRRPLELVGDRTALTYALNELPPSPTALPYVRATGVWMNATVQRVTTSNYVVNWPVGGPRLRADKFDRLYFAFDDLVGAPPQYRATTRYRFDDVTIENGASVAVSTDANRVGLTAQPLDRCMRVRADNASELARLMNVSAGTPGGAWYVFDLIDPSFGFLGQGVAYHYELNNTDRDVQFGDPMPGVNGYGTDAHVARTIKLAGASQTVFAGVYSYMIPPASTCGTPAAPPPTVALPGRPRIGGIELTSDDQHITIDRDRPSQLEWDVVSPGTVDLWIVYLHEIAASGSNIAYVRNIIYYTVELDPPAIVIDPDDLRIDTSYVVDIYAVIWHPGAPDGDFVTRRYPGVLANTVSTTFTIDK